MKWWRKRREPRPSAEAQAAGVQADRALLDAEALRGRAEEVARSLEQTRRTNHFREAWERAARRA